ncbi:MAG TPA: alpha/beta fold hydrolase [Acidimicrobiales bacterium]|nr:alpha/beta fold hydrolase [Acidimicrobiales bacterium]
MRIGVEDIELEVQVEEPDHPDAPAVLLLHGWPDSHRLWRHQVPALTAAGFRTVAPDLRGFGASDRPDDVAAYGLAHILGDVVGVLDHLGLGRAHVVGHDWGAAVAWALAALIPDRVDHLVALSVGHPAAFRAAGLPQREKSWYMLLFQFEGIAERWLSDDDFANFRAWAQHPDADAVIAELSRPGALTASLNWYRANLPPATLVEPAFEVPPVARPTMGVWSKDDMALIEENVTGSADHVTGGWRYERIDGAAHWIPLEAPDELTALLLDFLPPPG